MRPETWRRVDKILSAALLLRPDERAAFLDEACGDNDALRREVESLLAADERSGEALDHPTGWMSDQFSAGVHPGMRLGPYRLGERIGEGGMSVVYEGQRDDQRYERKVAVKFLREGFPDPRARSRFEAEGRILASLDHPHIARLLDVGSLESGWPYLVMEHVDGERIDRFCQRQDLSIDRRLDLFLQVCAAVRYAHQQLVIHRDLKPSNILVTYDEAADGEATVKLLDFGIAKLLDPTAGDDRTVTRFQPMTPQYASPEQLKGRRATLATDVYSMGVLLFQLLTDRLPHDVDGSPDSVQRFLTDLPETPLPSAVLAEDQPERRRRELAGDLDNIARKALAREVAERYSSAEELAEDLRRYRDGLPVRARRPTAGYRLAKFVGRNRTAVTSALGLVILLGAFAVAMTVLALEVRQERDAATRERDAAREVSSFLVDLFALSGPAENRGETITAREILDRGAERIERELAEQPAVRARMQEAIGRAYLELGLLDRAQALLEASVAGRRQASDEDPLALAESLSILGEVEYEQASNLERAEALAREASALQHEHLPADDPARILGRLDLGYILARQGRHQESLEIAEEAAAALRRRLGDDHWHVGSALSLQAGNLERLGEPEQALVASRRATEILSRRGEDHPVALTSKRQLANLLAALGQPEEALAMDLEVLEIQRRVLGEQHLKTAFTYNHLASLCLRLGRLEEAEDYARRGLEIRQDHLGVDHLSTSPSLSTLADALSRRGKLPEGIELAEQAVRVARLHLPPDSPVVAFPLVALGRLQLAADDPSAAEPGLREALALVEGGLPPGHPRIYSARRDLGRSLAAQGRHDEAEELWRSILEEAPDSPQAAEVRELLED